VIEDIRYQLSLYVPKEVPREDRPSAAVLIPLYFNRDSLHVVLTKRTDRVEHHKGEISFPGGARDPDDRDLVETALRESAEEIGLLPQHVDVLGRVDDFITISQFHVTAYVGAIDPSQSPYLWRPAVHEVAEVLEVPLDHLYDPRNLSDDERVLNGQRRRVPAYQFGEHLIWGATQRILQNFLEVARGAFDRREEGRWAR
jgi:8-oxo-dGTP pyrophosphatase MutT (NUDIX family)